MKGMSRYGREVTGRSAAKLSRIISMECHKLLDITEVQNYFDNKTPI
jgi:hypothetical protein